MLVRPPREPRWASWLAVAAWSLLIFLSVPVARQIQLLVSERWGRESFSHVTLAVIVAVAVTLVLYLWRTLSGLPLAQTTWLLGVTAAYIYISTRLKAPEETLHFIEYGVLGVLVFRALSHRLRDATIYLRAILVGTLLGTLDEILQWITPERFFDFHDVGLNLVSAALAQVALWRGVRPAYISGSWSGDGVRQTCRLAIAAISLLTVCALNTPQRVAWYATRFPALANLDGNPSVMAEYGYRHEDPGIGTFFSRLSLEELARQDRERGEAAAALIDRYAAEGTYGDFLVEQPAARDPFAYELRVHIFRRDRYLDRARREGSPEALDAELATIAWREQRILAKYFGNALGASTFALKPWGLRALEQAADPQAAYTSDVSRHLITRFDEVTLLIAAALAIFLLTVLPGLVTRLAN